MFPHKKDDKTANKNSTENFTRDQRLSITFSLQNLRTGRDNRGLMRLKHFLWAQLFFISLSFLLSSNYGIGYLSFQNYLNLLDRNKNYLENPEKILQF